MSTLRRISERHQITIPPSLLAEAGIPEGAMVSIVAEKGRIVLEPRTIAEDDLSQEDWDELEKLVRRQEASGLFTEYRDPESAKGHFKKLRK